ncbi:hypothetical protein D3C73_1375590 [compost metagenome]
MGSHGFLGHIQCTCYRRLTADQLRIGLLRFCLSIGMQRDQRIILHNYAELLGGDAAD